MGARNEAIKLLYMNCSYSDRCLAAIQIVMLELVIYYYLGDRSEILWILRVLTRMGFG